MKKIDAASLPIKTGLLCLLTRLTHVVLSLSHCCVPWKANTHVGIEIISLPPTSPPKKKGGKKRCQTTLGPYKTSTVRPSNPSTHWSINPGRGTMFTSEEIQSMEASRLLSPTSSCFFSKVETSLEQATNKSRSQEKCPGQKKRSQKYSKKKQVQWTVTWQWNLCIPQPCLLGNLQTFTCRLLSSFAVAAHKAGIGQRAKRSRLAVLGGTGRCRCSCYCSIKIWWWGDEGMKGWRDEGMKGWMDRLIHSLFINWLGFLFMDYI